MREVRMTFGEHLEELRRRILVSLLYFGLGVTIALIYGEELMQVTLVPHQRAFRDAQADRQLREFARLFEGLRPLMTMDPSRALLDGKPMIEGDGDVDWSVLFAGDLARARLTSALAEPYERAADEVAGALSLPPPAREKVRAALRGLGAEEGEILARFFLPSVAVEDRAEVARRFVSLERKLRELRADQEQSSFGLLDDQLERIDEGLASLEAFNRFLGERREQVIASELDLAAAEALSKERSRLGEALLEVHRRLDEIVDVLRSDAPAKILVISYMENFYAHLKVAVIFGLLFSIPFILYELWKFVGAGLYIHEQRYVVTFLPFSLTLFVIGGTFGYFILIPIGLTFLATWGEADVDMSFTLGSYVGLFFTLTLVLGLAFQTPLIMVFLLKIGAVTVEGFRKARKMAILVGVIVSAILTPPDPFTLALMAGPMILLYEFGILVCRVLTPRASKEAT